MCFSTALKASVCYEACGLCVDFLWPDVWIAGIVELFDGEKLLLEMQMQD